MKNPLLCSSIFILILCFTNSDTMARPLPINPAVTPETIDSTICIHGYSHSVRPAANFTNEIKKRLLDIAGIPTEDIHSWILDHRISIAAGGSPDDPRNMVLQKKEESLLKDRAENRAHDLICSHRIDLRTAQRLLWTDWRKLLPTRTL